MLGRAAKAYEPPAGRNEFAKQNVHASNHIQKRNIEAEFKKARQPSQSISGFTGVTNISNPLRPKSPNIKQGLKRKSESFSSAASTSTRLSVFSRTDSFHDTPDTIDLTIDTQVSQKTKVEPTCHVEFDENDFDDDADLDLDVDYPIPSAMSMAAPPKPTSQKLDPPLQSPSTFPQSRPVVRTKASHFPSSSAPSWPSSSPSHFVPPPGALARQRVAEQAAQQSSSFDEEADIAPRRPKRRTLPWAQREAEEKEIAARNEDRAELLASQASSPSSAYRTCFRCNEKGHFVSECPKNGRGKRTAWDYTPIRKDKSMPWNTTASAVKEQQRLFKEKKKAAKLDDAVLEALEDHNRPKRVVTAPVTLSEEQKRVRDLVVDQQKSVFFTGSAGTGKSVLMRSIIEHLRRKYVKEPDRIAVTASTGLAACNIGGVTLHSFGGIGLGKEDIPSLVKKIKRNQKAKNRWIRTKILIIDEISMVDGDLFDKLEGIARAMRNNGRPFGGIQLVITGDFFQLPPVPDYDSKDRGVKFAFDATTWSTAIHHTIGLTEVFRQKDPGTSLQMHQGTQLIKTVFANMLNEMRLGKITEETIKAFRKLSRPIEFEDALDATELYVINVDSRNYTNCDTAFPPGTKSIMPMRSECETFMARAISTKQSIAGPSQTST